VGSTPEPDAGIAHAETIAPVAGEARSTGLQRGDALGRYVILEHLASGGMGAVYRAYDPDLDRAIAVKLVRVASGDDTGTSGSSARMMREAQALARLSHPNVIAIYDVGVAAGDVFLAMELVEGMTLRAWLAGGHPRDLVLAMLIGAGRGLAAAHAAGIVHRDVKPENILVGADGRVRVVDFGLAGATDAEAASDDDLDTPVPRSISGLSTPLTRTGEMFGTPHYMAPEQYARRAVAARAYQFAFGVPASVAL
jgi:serine/threonine protein kinase